MGFIDKIENDIEFMSRCEHITQQLERYEASKVAEERSHDEIVLNNQPYILRFLKCTEQAVRRRYMGCVRSGRDVKINEVRFGENELNVMGVCKGLHKVRIGPGDIYTKGLIRDESKERFIKLLQYTEPSVSYVDRMYNVAAAVERDNWSFKRLVSDSLEEFVQTEPDYLVVVRFDPALSSSN